MLCIAGQANAQQYGQELELGSISGWGWSAKTITISDQEIPQLPASVNLPGQYGEISVTESFNATDIKSFKFELAEPIAAGRLQISIRNQAQTSTSTSISRKAPRPMRAPSTSSSLVKTPRLWPLPS